MAAAYRPPFSWSEGACLGQFRRHTCPLRCKQLLQRRPEAMLKKDAAKRQRMGMTRSKDVIISPSSDACLLSKDRTVLGERQLHQVAEGLGVCAAACSQRSRHGVTWLTRATVGSHSPVHAAELKDRGKCEQVDRS